MGCCSGNKNQLNNEENIKNRTNYKKNFIKETNVKSINDIKIIGSNLVIENKQPLNKTYRIISTIGNGSFGKVYKSFHIPTNQERAIKEIVLDDEKNKDNSEEKIFKEIELLSQIDHPHIMKIYEYFKENNHLYISMELLEGGDLYDYLYKIKSFTEKDASIIMYQLLNAVNYLHQHNIIHRDLKPENIAVEIPIEIERSMIKSKSRKQLKEVIIKEDYTVKDKENHKEKEKNHKMLSSKILEQQAATSIKNKTQTFSSVKSKILNSDEINIKLIDFGASCSFSKNQVLHAKAGTPYYLAPEVLNKEYNFKCDIWSCGVILYILLIGKPPFDGQTSAEVYKKIKTGKFDRPKEWNKLSLSVRNLIIDMMTLNFELRPTAKQCLNYEWFRHMKSKSISTKSVNKIVKNNQLSSKFISKFNQKDSKDSINKSFCSNSSKIDDNDGKVKETLLNLKRFSVKNKFQQATIAFLVRHVASKNLFTELRKIFKDFDTNNDGILSYEEIKKGFEKYNSDKEIPIDYDDIIKRLDQDQNNEIEYEEFLRNFVDLRSLLTSKNLKIAFEMFDIDHNGVLSLNEIKEALGVLSSNSNLIDDKGILNKILVSMDSDGNGTISFDEFEKLMRSVL